MKRDAILFVTALVLLAGGVLLGVRWLTDSDGSASADICDTGLGGVRVPLSPDALARADARLVEVAQAAREGDLERARQAFFPFADAVTHDMDARLRAEGRGSLARELCESVIALEIEFVILEPDLGRIEEEADMVRQLMRRAAEELGLEVPPSDGR